MQSEELLSVNRVITVLCSCAAKGSAGPAANRRMRKRQPSNIRQPLPDCRGGFQSQPSRFDFFYRGRVGRVG